MENILIASRAEAGRVRVQVEPVVVQDLVKAVLSQTEVLATVKDLALDVRIEEGAPERVDGDPILMERVLVNLVANGIKFTDEGSVTVEIAGVDAERWTVRVRDTGPGISAEAQERLFEAFGVGEDVATRSHQGAGLGLYIVKLLSGMMGGSVSMESAEGVGSTFTVVLPIRQEQPDGEAEEASG
jgi:signal transduction histidine kinase